MPVSKSNARVIVLAGAAALAGIGYTLGRRAGSRGSRSIRESTNPKSSPRPRLPAQQPPDSQQLAARASIAPADRAHPQSEITELSRDAARISSAPDTDRISSGTDVTGNYAALGSERTSSTAARNSSALGVDSTSSTAGFDDGPSAADGDRLSGAPDALDVALDLDGLFDAESDSGVQLTARTNDHASGLRSGDDEDAPAPEDLGRIWLEQATESEHGLGLADTIPDVENLSRARRDLLDSAGLAAEGEVSEGEDETTAEYIRRHRISSVG